MQAICFAYKADFPYEQIAFIKGFSFIIRVLFRHNRFALSIFGFCFRNGDKMIAVTIYFRAFDHWYHRPLLLKGIAFR